MVTLQRLHGRHYSRSRLAALLCLAGCLVAPSPLAAAYLESFQPDDETPTTALLGTMSVGDAGGWSAHMEGGFYLLENRTDPTAVRYFYVLPGKGAWSDPGGIVRAEIGGMFVGGDYHAGAGLLFRFEPTTRHYYAFVLQEKRSYALYRRDGDGLNALLSGSHEAIEPAGRNRLEVWLRGDAIHLLINGVEIGSIESNQVHGEGVGLIALGEGRFEFDNFELPEAVMPAQASVTPHGPALQTVAPRRQYPGRFTGNGIEAEFSLQSGVYSGNLKLGPDSCTLQGHYDEPAGSPPVFAHPVVGEARCGNERYGFRARLRDRDHLEFDLEGLVYQLKRETASTSGPSPAPASKTTRVQPPPKHLALKPQTPPAGFQPLPQTTTGGTLLIRRENVNTVDAKRLLRSTLQQFASFFDGKPQLLNAIGDDLGRELQVMFSARLRGMPVEGLAMVVLAGDQAVTTLAYDSEQDFPASLPGMLKDLAPRLPKPPPAAAQQAPILQQTPLPDGSGSIGLPPGWQITSADKGMVDASGADGCMVSLGIHGSVYTPQEAAKLQQNLHAMGFPSNAIQIPVVPYSDPASAFSSYWQQMPALVSNSLGKQIPAQRVQRIVEQSPRPWPGGQAAMMDVAWLLGDGAEAVPYRSIVLFGMQPGYGGVWTSYLSIVSSPAEHFTRNIPTLFQMWNSWRVSNRVYEERIKQAVNDMREVGRIIDQVHARREASFDAIHADWTEYIRGTTTVADPLVGELHEVPLYDVERLVDGLNQAAGYERYQHIPLRDLQ